MAGLPSRPLTLSEMLIFPNTILFRVEPLINTEQTNRSNQNTVMGPSWPPIATDFMKQKLYETETTGDIQSYTLFQIVKRFCF